MVPTMVNDITTWNGKLVADLTMVGKLIIMDYDGNNQETRLDSVLISKYNCHPNGLETTPDGKYVLIACFQVPGASGPPVKGLLRWDPTDDSIVTVADASGGPDPAAVDGIYFEPSGRVLFLSIGIPAGSEPSIYSQHVMALTSDDDFETANVHAYYPSGVSPLAY